jgi:putative endonuclease
MYILECADESYYTGSTKDLERRLWEHQNGLGANHTAKRLPVKLVYCEECDRIDDAFYREKQVQGWSRKKKEALMASDYNQIHLLAMCKNETHCANIGFDSAQPTGSVTAELTDDLPRSLSGVEWNDAETCDKGMVG